MSLQSVREIKKHILALIEEYSENNLYISDDDDINKKIIPLINLNIPFLASQTVLKKKKRFEIEQDTEADENDYTGYSLGSSFQSLLAVRVISGENLDYYLLNKKLYIKNNFTGIVEAEFSIVENDLTDIDVEDLDDTELDLRLDVITALCYLVAGDILKTDVSVDYTAFEEKATRILQTIDPHDNETIGAVLPIFPEDDLRWL